MCHQYLSNITAESTIILTHRIYYSLELSIAVVVVAVVTALYFMVRRPVVGYK